MSLLDVIRYRWRVMTHPRRHEQEVAEEFDFHLDLETMQGEHAASDAKARAEAKYAARRRLGNATYYQEETRRTSGLEFFDTLMQDVRFALRTFRGAPISADEWITDVYRLSEGHWRCLLTHLTPAD